jgi:hypothetical protein
MHMVRAHIRKIHEGAKKARPHLHPTLVRRLALFFIFFLALAGLIAYDVYASQIDPLLALAGFAIGCIVGWAAGRMFKIFWHEKDEKVVMQMDRMGLAVLAIYFAFSASKAWLFGHWIVEPALTAFGFSIVAGVMLGRLLGMGISIRKILKGRGHL